MATASTINRLNTVEAYMKWVSYRVPAAQMKELHAFLKTKGISPSSTFPKMTAENNKVCYEKNNCMIFTNASVTLNGVEFKAIDKYKPFPQVISDICTKIGCNETVANLSLIPRAHAGSKGTSVLMGLIGGALIGGLAAPHMGGTKKRGAIAGGVLGAIGAYILESQNKQPCTSGCKTSCDNNQYYITPYQPAQPFYDQQAPPYSLPPDVHYQAYNQYPPPCSGNTGGGQTDLDYALNNPPQTVYCNNACTAPAPFDPNFNYSPGVPIQGQPPYPQNPYGQPASIVEKEKENNARKAASEEKK